MRDVLRRIGPCVRAGLNAPLDLGLGIIDLSQRSAFVRKYVLVIVLII